MRITLVVGALLFAASLPADAHAVGKVYRIGVLSYGTDRRDLFRRAAIYVDRIFKGARPGDLPAEPPTKFELAINLRIARTLGLRMSPSLLGRADHVVQ